MIFNKLTKEKEKGVQSVNSKIFKRSLAIIGVIIITFSLVTCGSVKDMPLNQVLNEMKSKGVVTSNMKSGGEKELKRFYKLNSNDFQEFVLYLPSSSMDVEEMLIVKVKDKSQIDAVESAIENRVNNQLESFNGYGAEQCALLDEYELKTIGNYVFFCVGKNAADIADSFKAVVN